MGDIFLKELNLAGLDIVYRADGVYRAVRAACVAELFLDDGNAPLDVLCEYMRVCACQACRER